MNISQTLSYLLVVAWSGTAFAQIIEDRDDRAPGREISEAMTLIYRFTKAHNGALPENWSEIWDAQEVASQYRSLRDRPMVHRQIAFVEPATQVTVDGSGTRIVAITRDVVSRPFGNVRKGEPEWVDQRLIVFQTKDGKLRQGSVDARKPLRGVNLDDLVLKEPNLTDQQIAETVKVMVLFNFEPDRIRAALGNGAIDTVKKSGLLDQELQKIITEKPPQLASTPTVVASTPRPSATAPTVIDNEKPSSGFPIVAVVILAGVIAGAAVFFLRRDRP